MMFNTYKCLIFLLHLTPNPLSRICGCKIHTRCCKKQSLCSFLPPSWCLSLPYRPGLVKLSSFVSLFNCTIYSSTLLEGTCFFREHTNFKGFRGLCFNVGNFRGEDVKIQETSGGLHAYFSISA